MAGKSAKGKATNRNDQPGRQIQWPQLIFGILAVILVLSMLLSLLVKY
jgi:hypothetical protein